MHVVVLTGAGISAESGLATFRDSGGLWEGHDPDDVATPEAFATDPDLVQRFYDARRAQLDDVQPNAAHSSLATLGRYLGGDLTLITQNVDDLHERAGSTDVLHMHGRLRAARCTTCGGRHEWRGDLGQAPRCPTCDARTLRPDVVWFGEVPYHLGEIQHRLLRADVFCSIGTSGAVYPAAGFAGLARSCGARTVELNLERTLGLYDESRTGPATRIVPEWVEEITAG